MSDFKAKMHHIRFLLGLRPRPRWGTYSALPDPLAVFKGPTSKGKEGKEGEGKERGEERRGGLPPIGASGSASDGASLAIWEWHHTMLPVTRYK